MPSDNEQETQETVSSVYLKPPVFSETSVPTWFRVLEAQFHIGKIISLRTKYFHALAQLPTDVVERISPAELDSQDYSRLKAAVISIYEQRCSTIS